MGRENKVVTNDSAVGATFLGPYSNFTGVSWGVQGRWVCLMGE